MKNPNKNNILIQQKYKNFFDIYICIYFTFGSMSQSLESFEIWGKEIRICDFFFFKSESFFWNSERERERVLFILGDTILIILLLLLFDSSKFKLHFWSLDFGQVIWLGAVWSGELFGSAHRVGTKKIGLFKKKKKLYFGPNLGGQATRI